MCTVDLHAVHADGLGIAGGLGKSCDNLSDILAGHAVDHHLAVLFLATRAIARHAAVRLGAQAAHAAHMPQLRHDAPAFGVHRVDHPLPASQGVLTVKTRHVGVAIGGQVADRGAFGDDQPNAGGGAAAVVLDHPVMGHAARREGTGHWRHDHAGRQVEGAKGEGLEQRVAGHAALPTGEEMRQRVGGAWWRAQHH